MITITITDSPDLLSTGKRELFLHHITIGKSLKNTIAINDHSLNKEHLELRTTTKGLIVEGEDSFILNDKKVQGILILQKGDQVIIGNTSFTITDFNLDNYLDADRYYEFLEDIEIRDPKLYKVISALEDEFIKLTTEKMNDLD